MPAMKMRASAICVLLLAAHPLAAQEVVPGTARLVRKGDPALEMVEGIHRYLDRETAQAGEKRGSYWHRDYSTAEAYGRSVEANRARLREMIGAVDPRPAVASLEVEATTSTPALVAEGTGYRVYAVRWPALEGVAAEGLLLEPAGPPVARVVALPDADWTPEMLAGLAPGAPPEAQFARRLAENGCLVVIPVLVNRNDTWSGIPGIRMTNQPHREFLYRMSFEAGRHIIGYEVQKVLALVDWFARENAKHQAPIAVAGYGEGGLVAFYSAALDTRIDASLVSGYFQPRERLWKEPVYRDVWGLTREFGDADIASLIAPRRLVIEASLHPEVNGPPAETQDRKGATPNGRLATPPFAEVEAEAGRARRHFAALGHADSLRVVRAAAPGSDAALQALRGKGALRAAGPRPSDRRAGYDPQARMKRQFDALVAFTQRLVERSPAQRAAFQPTQATRERIWSEMIGRLPEPSLPVNARTRLVYDEPKFRGYEVMLDVWPDVFAYGILLVPKDVQPGERRPVVVCQHGLEGRARDAADPKADSHYYHRFAVQLAEQGFVTYAPQNPYIGQDRFRLIQRKGHPLKLSLFSFILGQHQRTLEWLASLPFVDASRIGFYGLSYGGKTAMRVPPLLTGYALSICSADFNEWVWKTTSVTSRYSYMLTQEYDMLEWNLANTANYSELASLMAPRPFMVERGHDDGVAPDEWVAYEFAKVRRFYDKAGLGDKAEIEFFNGPHTIHGVGTFEFLRKHLGWTRE
ncbi:MAG: hypothetical protein LC126_10250 [Bryobacterales bacterium]|nr:hypothetical protein [Bryobacterales bacterium]